MPVESPNDGGIGARVLLWVSVLAGLATIVGVVFSVTHHSSSGATASGSRASATAPTENHQGASSSVSASSSPVPSENTTPSSVASKPVTPSVAFADPNNADFVTDDYQTGTYPNVGINGKISAWVFVGTDCTGTGLCSPADDMKLDLDLSRAYSRFTARIGATDQSEPGQTAVVTMRVDGRQVFQKTVAVGTSWDVNIPVKNVLILEITTSFVHANLTVAIGDPTGVP